MRHRFLSLLAWRDSVPARAKGYLNRIAVVAMASEKEYPVINRDSQCFLCFRSRDKICHQAGDTSEAAELEKSGQDKQGSAHSLSKQAPGAGHFLETQDLAAGQSAPKG